MSKQDIEKRLGFAAQGVKAEMAIGSYKQGDRTVTVNGKKYEVLPYQMDFFIKELATLDTPEWRADVVKEYLRRGYIKSTASRPGAKAKFIRFMDLETWKDSKGTVFTAGIEEDSGNRFQPYVTARDSSGGDQLRTLNAPVFKTEKGARKWLSTWMQSNKSTSARPGVKAKFEKEYVLWGLPKGKTDRLYEKVLSTQAKTPAQMEDVKKRASAAGWHSFRVQILDLSKPYKGFARSGVKAKFADAALNQIRNNAAISDKIFTLVSKGLSVPQAIDSVLGEGTYKRIGSEVYDELKKAKSSRPGVKAKFAKPQFRTKKLHNGYIAVEVNQGSGWERYDTTHEESWNGIEGYERGYQKAYDRGLRYSGGAWRIPSTTASRPGAKAKMGWREDTNPRSRQQTLSLHKERVDYLKKMKGATSGDAQKTADIYLDAGQGDLNFAASSKFITLQEHSALMREIEMAYAKATASRPGAKAKMGSSQVNDSATTADLIREAQRLRDVIKTSNREFDKTHLRQIKQELDKRGVLMPYGASEVLASRSGMKAKA